MKHHQEKLEEIVDQQIKLALQSNAKKDGPTPFDHAEMAKLNIELLELWLPRLSGVEERRAVGAIRELQRTANMGRTTRRWVA